MADGFSKTRLVRMHEVLAGHVERGSLPGLVALVSRRGAVHVDVIGTKALGGAEPMERDSIFRIASVTKPVIAVAALMLAEDCLFSLDEPIDRLLPELANQPVLRTIDAELDDTVPARRPVTIRDLLTFRNGLGMNFQLDPDSPISKAIAGVNGFGPPQHSHEQTPDEWIAQLADVPLMYQPGERWLYNTGIEMLGVLLARAAKQPLDQLLVERIFTPLGMSDTGFHIPEDKRDRLTAAYMAHHETGELTQDDEPATTKYVTPSTHPSAGGGLLSTIDDLYTFTELLRNNGRRGADRLLSRPTVQAMVTDQLTPQQKAVSGFFPDYFESRGWGFGLAVGTKNDGLERHGRYGWDGGSGTSWYTDPAEDLTAILLTQRGGFPTASPVYRNFWALVYAAIDD